MRLTQPDFPLSTGRPQLELRVPLWVLQGLTAQADAAGTPWSAPPAKMS